MTIFVLFRWTNRTQQTITEQVTVKNLNSLFRWVSENKQQSNLI